MGRVPRPEARRAGLRPAEAGADVGDHRPLHDVDDDLRRAGARQRQHGAARPRRDRRAEGAVALAEPARRDLQRVRAHRAVPRRRRSDRDRHDRDASTATSGCINGHKWFITNASVADIVLVFAETNPEGRPHKHASIFVVPTGTPGMEIVRDIGTMAHPDVEYGRAGQPRRDRVPRLPRAGRPPDRRAGRRLRARAAAPRRWPHPPRDALARPGAALARHHVRAGRVADVARQAARPAPDGPGLRRAVAHGDPGRPAAHVPDRVEDGQARRGRGAGRPRHGQGARVEGRARACSTAPSRCAARSATRATCRWRRGTAATRFGPIGDGPDELHKSVLARTLLKGYTPVEGWPTEHIPSRRPAAEAKWAELRHSAGLVEAANASNEH